MPCASSGDLLPQQQQGHPPFSGRPAPFHPQQHDPLLWLFLLLLFLVSARLLALLYMQLLRLLQMQMLVLLPAW